MRVQYKDLMNKLGVDYEMSPYETKPWFLYDTDKGITCSAEIRIGPGAEDVELEIQFLYDSDDERYQDEKYNLPDQIMLMRFEPSKDQIWAEKNMLIKGESYANKIHNWGERGCEFFCSCIGAIQMGELPDIDAMIESDLTDSKRGGGRRGRVGKKGLKMQQQQPPPMGMGGKP